MTSLYPCVKVTTGDGGLFGGASRYDIYLDCQHVFTSDKLTTALVGSFGLYIIFGVEWGLFGGACRYDIYLDRQHVLTSNKLTTELVGSFGLYFIFGVQYQKKLWRTCTFVSAHILGLPEPQISAVQSLYNSIVT